MNWEGINIPAAPAAPAALAAPVMNGIVEENLEIQSVQSEEI